MTQGPVSDITKPHQDQRNYALAILLCRFNTTQIGCSFFEKDSFTVLTSLSLIYWLAARHDGFDLHTDHSTLIFILYPLSVVPNMTQTSVRNVLR